MAMILVAGATSFLVGNAFQAQMPAYANYLGADETGTRYTVLLAADAAGALGAAAVAGAALARGAAVPPHAPTRRPATVRSENIRRIT